MVIQVDRLPLQLWEWRTGEVKLQLHQKSFSRDNWPLLQLTATEDFTLHLVVNSVNIYDTSNPAGKTCHPCNQSPLQRGTHNVVHTRRTEVKSSPTKASAHVQEQWQAQGFIMAIHHMEIVRMAGVAKKLSLKGVGGFAVSPDAKVPVVAAFVPEGKGIPGFVGLWRLEELQKGPISPQPYCRRSFFRVRTSLLTACILHQSFLASSEDWHAGHGRG